MEKHLADINSSLAEWNKETTYKDFDTISNLETSKRLFESFIDAINSFPECDGHNVSKTIPPRTDKGLFSVFNHIPKTKEDTCLELKDKIVSMSEKKHFGLIFTNALDKYREEQCNKITGELNVNMY